jgi:uncharacterized membrane protein YfcA
MAWQQTIIIILIGVTAGLLSGLLGLGGAIIIIPALVMLLGFSQQMAQGTTLVMLVLPVGALAAWQYYKEGSVDIKTALILSVSFFISGYFGAKFAGEIPQAALKKIFAVLLMVIAGKMLFFDK